MYTSPPCPADRPTRASLSTDNAGQSHHAKSRGPAASEPDKQTHHRAPARRPPKPSRQSDPRRHHHTPDQGIQNRLTRGELTEGLTWLHRVAPGKGRKQPPAQKTATQQPATP